MLTRVTLHEGFTLIEVMIALTVLGIVLMIGLPNLATWMQNTQIRTAAEGLQSGLQLARAEAIKRNKPVRFQLVTSLTSGCVLSNQGTSWVVSQTDPTGLCDVAESESIAPQAIQKRDGNEGTPYATIKGLDSTGAAAASLVQFNGLGRVTGATPIATIKVENPTGGTCQPGGPMRCLQLTVSTGGEVRMCDPAVTDATDPRKC